MRLKLLEVLETRHLEVQRRVSKAVITTSQLQTMAVAVAVRVGLLLLLDRRQAMVALAFHRQLAGLHFFMLVGVVEVLVAMAPARLVLVDQALAVRDRLLGVPPPAVTAQTGVGAVEVVAQRKTLVVAAMAATA